MVLLCTVCHQHASREQLVEIHNLSDAYKVPTRDLEAPHLTRAKREIQKVTKHALALKQGKHKIPETRRQVR